MAYAPLTKIPQQFFDNLGNPLVGGTLYAYLAGTSTPTNMFSDNAGTVAGTSVVLDSRGEPTTFKLIWLNTTVIYKFILKDSTGTTIWTIDNISGDDGTGNTASSVFDQQTLTATAGQTLFNLGYEYVTGTNAMAVYKNGSRLITGTDFTETSSTSVTLTMAAIAGDEYTFIGGQDVSSSFSSSNVSFIQSGTGAVTRSVQTKLREIVSRSDYNSDANYNTAKVGKLGLLTTGGIETGADSSINGFAIGNGPNDGNPSAVAQNQRWGKSALQVNTTGYSLLAIGYETLNANTTGFNNTAVGRSALRFNIGGINNTAIGVVSLEANTSGGGNTAVGVSSLVANTTGSNNTGVGFKAGFGNISGSGNTAFGATALQSNSVGTNNTAVGYEALINATGNNNTAVGMDAAINLTTGSQNTAIGKSALFAPGTGSNNTAIGASAMQAVANVSNNTAVGYEALRDNNSSSNSALGRAAGASDLNRSNCTYLGANTAVTGSNQVQLGDSATTTYAYGAVQNRSDMRDKADVRDTTLGLSFITALRPVDFKWDYREDYGWQEKDGSKKRSRFHHGLIAQEVKAVLDSQGIDFGGFQDHQISGGDDVLSIGYAELIGPLIKAVQELKAEFDAYKASHP